MLPETQLAISYARGSQRMALTALFELDTTLANILRNAHDPLIGQMRYTWWHQALGALDTAPAPAQPLLQALAADVLPRAIAGSALAELVAGWEVLLDPGPLSDAAIAQHGVARGEALFTIAAAVLGADASDPVAAAGRGWAMVDLGVHWRDAAVRARCFALARPALEAAARARWSAAGRPLGMLAHLALIDCRAEPDANRRQGSPRRLLRMLRHRLTGR